MDADNAEHRQQNRIESPHSGGDLVRGKAAVQQADARCRLDPRNTNIDHDCYQRTVCAGCSRYIADSPGRKRERDMVDNSLCRSFLNGLFHLKQICSDPPLSLLKLNSLLCEYTCVKGMFDLGHLCNQIGL